MRLWLLALLVQVLILTLGFGLMGAAFTGVSISRDSMNEATDRLQVWRRTGPLGV